MANNETNIPLSVVGKAFPIKDAREKVNLNSLEICAGKGLLLVIRNNR